MLSGIYSISKVAREAHTIDLNWGFNRFSFLLQETVKCRVEAEGQFVNEKRTSEESKSAVVGEAEEVADEGKDEDLETERVADRICAGFNAKRVPRNQRQELRERLIMFKEKYRKLKSRKGKKPASKKRKRKISTEKEAWTDCFVPCPSCGEELRGWSTGVEPKKKVFKPAKDQWLFSRVAICAFPALCA